MRLINNISMDDFLELICLRPIISIYIFKFQNLNIKAINILWIHSCAFIYHAFNVYDKFLNLLKINFCELKYFLKRRHILSLCMVFKCMYLYIKFYNLTLFYPNIKHIAWNFCESKTN